MKENKTKDSKEKVVRHISHSNEEKVSVYDRPDKGFSTKCELAPNRWYEVDPKKETDEMYFVQEGINGYVDKSAFSIRGINNE